MIEAYRQTCGHQNKGNHHNHEKQNIIFFRTRFGGRFIIKNKRCQRSQSRMRQVSEKQKNQVSLERQNWWLKQCSVEVTPMQESLVQGILKTGCVSYISTNFLNLYFKHGHSIYFMFSYSIMAATLDLMHWLNLCCPHGQFIDLLFILLLQIFIVIP